VGYVCAQNLLHFCAAWPIFQAAAIPANSLGAALHLTYENFGPKKLSLTGKASPSLFSPSFFLSLSSISLFLFHLFSLSHLPKEI
jgi:hypothetical protein